MRYPTVAVALFSVASLALAEPEIVPVKLAVQCVENPQCTYDGWHMRLELTVTNIQSEAISLPVDFIARRGPFIKLTDTKTKREIFVSTGIPDYSLRTSMTVLGPGESFKFQWSISKFQIEELESLPVDANAEVTLVDRQRASDSLPARNYVGKTSFKITQ
jgi:hypothetical protein